jgi:hypothetical protein
VCNLYSITTNQAAIIALFRVINHYVGNLPPMPGVFPDYPAPVVRNDGGGREIVMMRWGMPPPPRAGGYPVTNIRNTSSPHWRGWLKPESRCLDRVQARLTGWGAPPAYAGAAAVLMCALDQFTDPARAAVSAALSCFAAAAALAHLRRNARDCAAAVHLGTAALPCCVSPSAGGATV